MSVLIKATPTEVSDYVGVYPLYGYAVVSGQRVTLEDLRGSWSKPDPVFELFTPSGFVFSGDGLHNVLFHTLAEVRAYLRTATVEECERPCTWCGARVHLTEEYQQ